MTEHPGYSDDLYDHVRELVQQWQAKGSPGSAENYVRQELYGNPLFVTLFLIPGAQALIAWIINRILSEEFGNGGDQG